MPNQKDIPIKIRKAIDNELSHHSTVKILMVYKADFDGIMTKIINGLNGTDPTQKEEYNELLIWINEPYNQELVVEYVNDKTDFSETDD